MKRSIDTELTVVKQTNENSGDSVEIGGTKLGGAKIEVSLGKQELI